MNIIHICICSGKKLFTLLHYSILICLLKKFFIPDLVNGPTGAVVAAKNCRKMALQISYQKSDSTIQQSFLCQLSFLSLPRSSKMPLDMSKWGLKIIFFI